MCIITDQKITTCCGSAKGEVRPIQDTDPGYLTQSWVTLFSVNPATGAVAITKYCRY